MALFSLSELNKLSEVRAKYELATNEYLQNPQNQNFMFVQRQYFDNNTSDTKLFNTWSWVFFSVANTIASFTGNPIGEIEIELLKHTRDLMSTGYTVMALTRVQDPDWSLVWKTQYVAPYQYVKRNEEEVVVRFYEDNQSNNTRYYSLVQTFTVWLIENKLYQVSETTDVAQQAGYTEVPLDTIPETANLTTTVRTWLQRSALFVVSEEDDIDNNISLTDKIKNIWYSIDRKLVMLDTQFLMNTESYILMSGITGLGRKLTEKASVHWLEKSDMRWRVILSQDPDAKVEFINNVNSLIDKAKEHITDQLKTVSAMTTVPMDFLNWDASHWNIWAGSRTMLHGAFMKFIEYVRKMYDPIIKEMYAATSMEIDYTWPDTFALPMDQVVDTVSIAVKSWLMSQETWIMKLQWLEWEQLEQEIDKILNDRILITNTQVNESWDTNMNEDSTNNQAAVWEDNTNE